MRPRAVLRIARWEVGRSASEVDRRTVVALLVVALALGAIGPVALQQGGAPNTGIYRVAVDEGNQFYEPVAASDPLRVVDGGVDAVGDGRADVAIDDGRLVYDDTQRGRAAMAALRSAVTSYNDRLMRQEADSAAAFPVDVTLRYRAQSGGTGPTDDGDGGGTGETTTDGDTTTPRTTTASTGGGANDGGGSGGLGGGLSGGGRILGGTQSGSPADIAPPFPMKSLLLAFAFVLPLNVVIQAYGSSIIGERLERRGEPLLVAPVSRGDIVAGKTLPYVVASLVAVTVIAVALGGGPLAVVAVVPILLLFLAATFVGAMFARSFKELTFVTVAVSVVGTTYAFVPAIFTDVHPIAAISPLSVVVADLAGTGTDLGTFAFATLPMTLVATVLFALGTGIYREEDMFTQRPPGAKALDALAAHLTRRRVPLWGALSVPFAFVAELFAIALLFVVPQSFAIPVLLTVVALVEEVAKSLFVYAGFERGRLSTAPRAAAVTGALAGLGFAVGEKITLAAQLVGLPDLELGRAAFAPAAAGDPLAFAALAAAPFVLHAVTAAVSAVGAARGARAYGATLTGAAALHLAYNLTVVSAVA
ncbi:MAG: ABC transporter permease subunit [Halobacteriaceae archaeon]